MLAKNKSSIVKCSHCKGIFSVEQFDFHECELPIDAVKEILVSYFRDDSRGSKSTVVGRGLDGVLYSFVVTPRTAISYMKSLTDDFLQKKRTDDKLTEPYLNMRPLGGVLGLTD